jgi:hypothetical protein
MKGKVDQDAGKVKKEIYVVVGQFVMLLATSD